MKKSRPPKQSGRRHRKTPTKTSSARYQRSPSSAPISRVPGAEITAAEIADRLSPDTPGVVTAVDSRRGAPSFFFANRDRSMMRRAARTPEEAARSHIELHRDLLGLTSLGVESARVADVLDTGRGGRLASIRQSVGGLEVYGTRMGVLMDRQNRLVALSGTLQAGTDAGLPVARAASIGKSGALAKTIEDITGKPWTGLGMRRTATDVVNNRERLHALEPAIGFRFPQPASVREVLYPMPKELVRAFHVEVELSPADSTDSRAYSYVIAADDGSILERHNLTVSHSYRVWADASAPHRPFDGPHGDHTPHPTGDPSEALDLGFVDRPLVDLAGFNHNPAGTFDPWLAAEASETVGNNVDAYADHADPSGFGEGDLRATVVPGGQSFDWAFDNTGEPFANQDSIMASVTQIFYVTNWLHDWYYDSGFNEAAGNAQKDNFDRGGVGDDPLLAEAQDRKGLSTNNANMSTPGDGLSPRMQMYLWNGNITEIGETKLTITAPETVAGDYEARASAFGIDDLLSASGAFVLAQDGGGEAGVPGDGCEELVTELTGKVALIDRGSCSFVQKAQNAEAAGAIAAIIMNNNQSDPDELAPVGGNNPDIKIPVLGVSFTTGLLFKEALAAESPLEGELTRAGRERDPFRDGTLDNSIVAHEWGHYFHHRLSHLLRHHAVWRNERRLGRFRGREDARP